MSTVLLVHLFTALALAHPRLVIAQDIIPTNLAVTWYQAPLISSSSSSSTTSCGFSVSEGQMNTTQCYALHTAALGLQQNERHECIFEVWEDGVGCGDGSGGDGTTSNSSSSSSSSSSSGRVVYHIPSGREVICVETDVLDGGLFQKKSGLLTCF
jgi:hypothetical protein